MGGDGEPGLFRPGPRNIAKGQSPGFRRCVERLVSDGRERVAETLNARGLSRGGSSCRLAVYCKSAVVS